MGWWCCSESIAFNTLQKAWCLVRPSQAETSAKNDRVGLRASEQHSRQQVQKPKQTEGELQPGVLRRRPKTSTGLKVKTCENW